MPPGVHARIAQGHLCNTYWIKKIARCALVLAELEGAEVVTSDNRSGGETAAHHLMQDGTKRFAFVGLHLSKYSSRCRYAGFVHALADFPLCGGNVERCEIADGYSRLSNERGPALRSAPREVPCAWMTPRVSNRAVERP